MFYHDRPVFDPMDYVSDDIKNNRQQGFTLIELSIALVIIGLLVGGVLVGQDLIKAAEIRATISQIEKYNSAVNSFRLKFNGIPGDLSAANAAAFGFTVRAGSTGRGDNNGLLDVWNGAATACQVWGQEPAMFWNDLSTANLIDGNFTSCNTNCDSVTPGVVNAASISGAFPITRLGRGNFIAVGCYSGLNYFLMSGLSKASSITGDYITTTNLTPIELYGMDTKLDDGYPLTGIVQAHGIANTTTTVYSDPPSAAVAATSGKCLVGDAVGTDTADTYNRSLTSGGHSLACIGRFRFN